MKSELAMACALVCAAGGARADGELAYVAPPECVSAAAFEQLVRAEAARMPNPAGPWHFSVTIRHEADFVGALKTEGGVRELRTATCDELTAALATIIAMVEPDAAPAPRPPPPALMRPPPEPPGGQPVSLYAPGRDETRIASVTLLGIGVAGSTAGVGVISFGAHTIAMARSGASSRPCQTSVGCPSRVDYSSSDRLGGVIIGGGAALLVGGLVTSLLGLKSQHVVVGGGPLGSNGITVQLSF